MHAMKWLQAESVILSYMIVIAENLAAIYVVYTYTHN